jgi:flagellar hook-associated protein FlgK
MINTVSNMGSAFQQGVSGLNASTRSMVESANELVMSGTVERAPTRTTDIVEPLMKIQQQQHVFDASAKVVKIADEALGALIDVKA